jgi:hypothetical protein
MKKLKTPWTTMRRVVKAGNSLAVTLPSLFAKGHGIAAGDILKVVIGETLQVHPPDYKPRGKGQALPPRLLSPLLAGVRP